MGATHVPVRAPAVTWISSVASFRSSGEDLADPVNRSSDIQRNIPCRRPRVCKYGRSGTALCPDFFLSGCSTPSSQNCLGLRKTTKGGLPSSGRLAAVLVPQACTSRMRSDELRSLRTSPPNQNVIGARTWKFNLRIIYMGKDRTPVMKKWGGSEIHCFVLDAGSKPCGSCSDYFYDSPGKCGRQWPHNSQL